MAAGDRARGACLIIGAGDGLGVRVEADVVALVERSESEVGPIEALVLNIGANVNFPIVDTTSQIYSKAREMACLAGFLTGREAARVMSARGRGSLLFTGATASPRGGAGYSAFGIPTFFVGEEMFFGKDRLGQVEEELLKTDA